MIQISLEAARVNAGYSQQEAGKLFGVHYQTIAKWESDNSTMPFDQIVKIPTIYGVPSDIIYFGKKNEFIRLLKDGRYAK